MDVPHPPSLPIYIIITALLCIYSVCQGHSVIINLLNDHKSYMSGGFVSSSSDWLLKRVKTPATLWFQQLRIREERKKTSVPGGDNELLNCYCETSAITGVNSPQSIYIPLVALSVVAVETLLPSVGGGRFASSLGLSLTSVSCRFHRTHRSVFPSQSVTAVSYYLAAADLRMRPVAVCLCKSKNRGDSVLVSW